IKIWKQINKFEEKSKFSTWIYRIATNQCLDILRKNKNRKVVSINQNEEWVLELEDTKINIEKQVEDAERLRVLKLALDELKKEQSEIIIMKDINNLSYDEIATKQNISLGTVKSRLSRARNALKNILQQDKEPFQSFWRHNNRKEGL
ncbi:RNA polymerase, partial [Candidatus Epulonipiscioides gigas]